MIFLVAFTHPPTAVYNFLTLIADLMVRWRPCGSNSVVECLLAKEDVASSNLVSRSILAAVKAAFFLNLLGLSYISEQQTCLQEKPE